jgi:hypothetical protein
MFTALLYLQATHAMLQNCYICRRLTLVAALLYLQATEQYRQLVASSYASALSLQEWQVNIDSISCAGSIVFHSTPTAGQDPGATITDSSSTGTRRMLLQNDISSATWDVTTATGVSNDVLGSTPAETVDVSGWDQDQSAAPSAETAVEVVTVFTVQVPVPSAGNSHVTEAVLQHSSNILSVPLSSFFAAAGAPVQSAMRLTGIDNSSDANNASALLTDSVSTAATAAVAGGLIFESVVISLTDDAYAAAMAAMVAPEPAPAPTSAPAAPVQEETAVHGTQTAAEGDSATAAAEHQLPGIPEASSSQAVVLVDQLSDQQQQQQQQQNTASTNTHDTTAHTSADVQQQEQEQQQPDTLDAAAAPTDMTADMSQAPEGEVTADVVERPAWSSADADAARAIIVTKMIEAAAAAAAQSRADAIEAIRELA